MTDILIIAGLAVVVGGIVWKMVNDKRKGKSGCGCGCSECHMKNSCNE